MTTRYIVMTRSAKMPSSVKAKYMRVGVVETTLTDGEPAMLSERAKGVVRIVQTWERMHAGRTASPGTAYGRAVAEAESMVSRLNAAA